MIPRSSAELLILEVKKGHSCHNSASANELDIGCKSWNVSTGSCEVLSEKIICSDWVIQCLLGGLLKDKNSHPCGTAKGQSSRSVVNLLFKLGKL